MVKITTMSGPQCTEQAFSAIKTYLQWYWQDMSIDCAIHSTTPQKAWGFFKALGYAV